MAALPGPARLDKTTIAHRINSKEPAQSVIFGLSSDSNFPEGVP